MIWILFSIPKCSEVSAWRFGSEALKIQYIIDTTLLHINTLLKWKPTRNGVLFAVSLQCLPTLFLREITNSPVYLILPPFHLMQKISFWASFLILWSQNNDLYICLSSKIFTDQALCNLRVFSFITVSEDDAKRTPKWNMS